MGYDGIAPPSYAVGSSSMLANVSLLSHSDLLLAASSLVASPFVRLRQMARLSLSMASAGALGMYWREGTSRDPAIANLIDSLRSEAEHILEGN
jgi:DNA-binding transcriptional LysR family regulator